MSQKKKVKSYEFKAESSKSTYRSVFNMVLKSGKSIPYIKRMNLKQYNNTFVPLGAKRLNKNSSLEAKKRILNQIKNDINQVVSDYIEKQKIDNKDYKTFIYNQSYKLFKTEKEPIKQVNELVEHKTAEKKGQYGTVKLINLANENEYYIKYTDEKTLKTRLNELLKKYEIKNYYTVFMGMYQYKTHIEADFKKRLDAAV